MSAETIPYVDQQVATIAAFVVKKKRDRYVDKISSPKKRPEFVRDLAHFSDFDRRFVVNIKPSLQTPIGIEALLRGKGATDTCFVISEWDSIDCRFMSIAEALKQVVGAQMGTILSCVPGRLAFFENEDGRFLLEKMA